MQRFIERSHLLPQAVHFRGKRVGGHIVIRAPHGAHVGKAGFARALVGQFDHALVTSAHRTRQRVPALPQGQQLARIAAGGENILHVVQGEAFAGRSVRTPLGPTVVTLERSRNLREFGAESGIARRRDSDRKLDQLEFALHIFGEIIETLEAVRLRGEFGRGGFHGFVRFGRHFLGVGSDEGFLHPLGALQFGPQIQQAILGGLHKLARFRRCGTRGRDLRYRCAGVFYVHAAQTSLAAVRARSIPSRFTS
jgi:hypothetical protein